MADSEGSGGAIGEGLRWRVGVGDVWEARRERARRSAM